MSGGELEGVIGAGGEALVADAAAQELKANSKGRVGEACANCGTRLVGRHCHACGQVADEMRRPFWSLFAEAIEGLFSLDGRFLTTVPALVLKPGSVTARYLKGERARFVQPFRLYLFTALIFLLAVSIVTGDWTDVSFDDAPVVVAEDAGALEEAERELEAAAARLEAGGDGSASAAAGLELAREGVAKARAEAQSAGAGPDVASEIERVEQRRELKCDVRRELLPEEPGACPTTGPDGGESEDGFNLNINGKTDWPIGVRRFLVEQADTIIDDPRRYLEAINRWIPRVLISLFPLYALLLGLMHFWKRRLFYYDHIVVSLHFHAFLFVLLSLLIALSAVVPLGLLIVAFFIWSNYGLYKTHRLVYGCGRFSSALRTLTLDFVYGLIVLCVAPVVLAIGGFLTA